MLYMWCNSLGDTNGNPKLGFNAARSILCGATCRSTMYRRSISGFNAARSILCGATGLKETFDIRCKFQCRTQHFMWCNDVRHPLQNGAEVSMPHAAFYVVQRSMQFLQPLGCAVSMPHAAFYVVQLRRSQPLSRAGREGVLESRRFFVPFSPYGAAFSPKNRGVNRRLPLCGAGLRQNGKSRR